ncbi:MAG: YraN family protein [Qingshengfaniella sp.]
MSGYGSHQAGLAAEEAVARAYVDLGYGERARRWRGPSGEIDFIAEKAGKLVFVEVKYARDHATAAARVNRAKAARLMAAAAGYLAAEGLSQDTECALDVALVDPMGRVELLRDAFV